MAIAKPTKKSVKPPSGNPREYTIDELARAGGTTVRNARAYQDRGLIAPPERRGRRGVYSDDHLSRLKLINHLLSRGYSLGNIQELLRALEDGQQLRDILGLAQAISSPWSDETPRHFSLPELLKLYGVVMNPRTLGKVIELGLLEVDGTRLRAPHPRILLAGAELSKSGLPLDDILRVVENLRANVERVADEMVQMIVDLLDRYGKGKLPPKDETQKLATLIWRLRPLAMMAIESEVSRALERSANKFLGDRAAQVLDQLQHPEAD